MKHQRRHRRFTEFALTWLVLSSILFSQQTSFAEQQRLYIACDDHTDYFWTADPDTYRRAFVEQIDYYLDRIDTTAGRPSPLQARFNCDGSLWMWEYERAKSNGDFRRLVCSIKDGHISVPLTPLSVSVGGAPMEAVLRGMYYAGRIQRKYDVPFQLAYSIENPTYPLGLGSLWAGCGAKYSWNGSYYGDTRITRETGHRPAEVYWWTGRDGRRILTKWYNFLSGDDLGGYAEARSPARAVDRLSKKAGGSDYPYLVAAAFGKGHDDLKTLTAEFEEVAERTTDNHRKVFVSNEVDFFRDFEATYSSQLPSLTLSFGNDWDLYPATIAEVSARVRRAVEKLRAAEAMATLVALEDPGFLDERQHSRDQAFMYLGLYFEHDFNMIGRDHRARLAWQRNTEEAITSYVDNLYQDSAAALGAMIAGGGEGRRFYVFNPLGCRRTDVAEYPYDGTEPVHVIDLATGEETPSEVMRMGARRKLRILASDLPSLGYKVFEICSGAGGQQAGGPKVDGETLENEWYEVTVRANGAITSVIDKRRDNREFVRIIDGRALNDLGPGDGRLSVEHTGPVSATLKVIADKPLARTTRVTLYRQMKRIDICNEITQNFDCDYTSPYAWGYSFDLERPDLWHEECGTVLHAKRASDGGHYSDTCARVDWLTMNHFADMTGSDGAGITLSNADCYFMKLGRSTPSQLDTSTPQISVLVGGRVGGSRNSGFQNQGGENRFLQRFALRTHGRYSEAAAIGFSMEHQNPPVAAAVTGGDTYPAESFSLVSISNPGIALWTVKPAEEGIDNGVVIRLWNHGSAARDVRVCFHGGLGRAVKTTHIETNLEEARLTDGELVDELPGNWMQTYRLFPRGR